jgi:hypothetical protein
MRILSLRMQSYGSDKQEKLLILSSPTNCLTIKDRHQSFLNVMLQLEESHSARFTIYYVIIATLESLCYLMNFATSFVIYSTI